MLSAKTFENCYMKLFREIVIRMLVYFSKIREVFLYREVYVKTVSSNGSKSAFKQ